MPNPLAMAGALSEPTSFAPLFTNRIFTGLWTNRSLLRDAATTDYQEHYGMGRQDSIFGGRNSEMTPRLTLGRRPGSSVYHAKATSPVNRFYSFNTFTLTTETIRVLADTATQVVDITDAIPALVWNKAANAGSTYFLSVGNILYFTNGVENKQWNYNSQQTWNWGIQTPTVAPTVSQNVKRNTYPSWIANTVICNLSGQGVLYVKDPNGNMQQLAAITSGQQGITGAQEPSWKVGVNNETADNQIKWLYSGSATWVAGGAYYPLSAISVAVNTSTGQQQMTFVCVADTTYYTGSQPPNWPSGIGSKIVDGGVTWQNVGLTLTWDANIGPNQLIAINYSTIVDPNGYIQTIYQPGKTGPAIPNFLTGLGALTTDSSAIWNNVGQFAVASTAPWIYGYEYMNSDVEDLSEMSPKSQPIIVQEGNQVTIQGPGSGDPQCDTVVLFRTAQGGSTFMELATLPNPGAGQTWTYVDNIPDSGLDVEWQAQVSGEGTPLPAGATCMEYHLGRIFVAVGNVVWISSGPDATVGGSSGNSGFDTFFTVQSKITRFWACSLGLVVFTVRDAYIILGSATDADPLYIVVFIQNLPLRSYDCWTVNKTTPYLFTGTNTLLSLDPSAGITEIGFPIADLLENEFDSSTAYLTFHAQTSRDTALYIGNGVDHWYRLSNNIAPESGVAWSPAAYFSSLGCIQSVEVTPGQFRLLMSGTAAGPILQRDRTTNADNGVPYPAYTLFGNIVLAQPGQLAALSFITLESIKVGTRPSLALLLGELSGEFEPLDRTRQDPTNIPPSNTLYSDRYHFAQNQQTAWCRHFQMQVSWPAEDQPNELLTFTIFGQTWQEMRAQ